MNELVLSFEVLQVKIPHLRLTGHEKDGKSGITTMFHDSNGDVKLSPDGTGRDLKEFLGRFKSIRGY